MANIDEIKIVVGDKYNYTRDEVILNLKFKYWPLKYYQCIVLQNSRQSIFVIKKIVFYILLCRLTKEWLLNFFKILLEI